MPESSSSDRSYRLLVHGLRHLHGRGVEEDAEEAFRLLHVSASRGCINAFFHLGMCYRKGWGVKKNDAEAFSNFRIGAAAGCQKAELERAKCLLAGEGEKKSKYAAAKIFRGLSKAGSSAALNEWGLLLKLGKKMKAALQKFRLAAFLGNCDATWNLAYAFWNGDGVVQDTVEGGDLFGRALEDGCYEALDGLGYGWADGHDVNEQVTSRILLHSKAAGVTHPSSYVALGKFHELGWGVQRDYAKAVRLYQAADELGCPRGSAHLGVMYIHGLGVPKDLCYAIFLFEKAHKDKDEYGEVCLGNSYLYGTGVAADVQTAIEHFRSAAKRGSSDGLLMLGVCSQKGYGVEVNVDDAFKTFRLSAEQSNAGGLRHLADCYWNGRGTAEDGDEAVRIYWRAADNGSQWALSILSSLQCQGDLQESDLLRVRRLLDHCIGKGCASCKITLAKTLLRGKKKSRHKRHACALIRDLLRVRRLLDHCKVIGKECASCKITLAETLLRGKKKSRAERHACALLQESADSGNLMGMVHFGLLILPFDPVQAFERFLRASTYEPEAQICVGFCYEKGLGVEINASLAKSLYKTGFGALERFKEKSTAGSFIFGLGAKESETFHKAIEAIEEGNKHGLARLGLCYNNGWGVEKNVEKARLYFSKAEERGSGLAAVELAKLLLKDGDEQIDKKLESLLHTASEQGYMEGLFELARCALFLKPGTSDLRKKAITVYEKYSKDGHAEAHAILGLAHDKCIDDAGFTPTFSEATRYYKLALDADMYNPRALVELGRKYLYGQGEEQNTSEGLKLLRRAVCFNRDATGEAPWILGDIVLEGEYGVEQNDALAMRYMQKSASLNFWAAYLKVGDWYAGVNYPKAIKYFKRAADAGHSAGMTKLALCLQDGLGCRKDEERAMELLIEAKKQGWSPAYFYYALLPKIEHKKKLLELREALRRLKGDHL